MCDTMALNTTTANINASINNIRSADRAQLLTYASFLSGAKVCHIIHKERSCAKLSPAPFLAGLNSTVLWLRYGFLANEWEIISVNFVGLVCSVVYLTFFLYYSNGKQRYRLLKQILILFIFLLTLVWSINYSVDPLFLGGSLASLSSLIACASPLATIQDVLKTRCVATLPFPIIVSSFVVSLSWLAFGYLKGDNFIMFSNIVAVSISGAQLALFAIYPSMMPYEKLSPSNKKSYDLIKLFNSADEELEPFEDKLENDICSEEINIDEDYRERLDKVIGLLYSQKTGQVTTNTIKSPGPVLLLYAT